MRNKVAHMLALRPANLQWSIVHEVYVLTRRSASQDSKTAHATLA
jgi:hypothetical protein